ncbi:hypothetical protein FOXG_18125 [Fusarium oxysporum f. sp. lycopersici 4287]|uniref:Transcription factor domain-containing protein n=1 Tax=Fusarium oxysporum f. sp. lycopersici (strain 4287 / CBS 123668 / FGSC 9935 / NRRL 34936) TaxID=426428 RepID=A0A0J9UB88_FUSO4|nr:hypothetical protein FOXG_18125 [Fusarium oxysporum f. sp. lycopersici 4287]KNA96269.1 hypothetical protein FOXG_18125 [Fusarium oxysporum f. sp. lycopersici 4287]
MAGMDKPPEEKRLLFINTNENNFPPRRNQHNSIDSEVRRHVMLDIGKARRKPSKDRQFVTLTWQTQKHTGKQESPKRRHYGHSKTPEECQATISTPTLYALAVFEKEWGEDSFSAYGFTLIMATGKNAMSGTYSANTFWSPFAFRKSAFLKHYQQIFSSPDVLIPLYRRSSLELKSIALERSLMTIQCIESRLASSDTSWATSDSVISAVLALICYNFSNLDFDQAMVHISGIWMVIEARGGISTLENNQDLLLMISWVDITAALLHNTKPLFPLPMNLDAFVRPGLNMLPGPLFGLLNDDILCYERFLAVLACMGDLNALATFLQTEQVTKGDAIWSDEEQMSLLLNPIAHDLLNQQQLEPPKPDTPYAIILESLRLGAIIWIIQVKRRCRSYPGTAQARITTLLRTISNDTEADIPWNCSADLQVVRLWLLVLCSVSEPSGQDYSTLMRIIASEMKELNLNPFKKRPSRPPYWGQLHLVTFFGAIVVSSFIMEDPNLTEAPGAAQCPSSQSAELKDSSGRPHCGQPIAGATPLGTPVGASEDDAESPGSTPLPSSAFKMAEGSTTNSGASIEPSSPSTIRGVMTPKPGSADISDGNADLEGSSSVSHEEAVLNLEDKIRQFESQLRERNESSSVLTVPYPSLKRKMQDELYDPVSKKMKPASQVSPEMGSLSTEVAGRYMSFIHNEVFRIAGRSGLINPADFDVGSDGVIGLSKHALKRVYSDDKS